MWDRISSGWFIIVLVFGCRASGKLPVGHRDVAEGLVLGHEWIEIEPEPPLEVEGRWPELIVHHSPELTLTRVPVRAKNTVYSPARGELIRLDVELVGRDGSVRPLGSGGLSPGRLALRPIDSALPDDFVIERLRLRSNLPFAISKLEWCEP